MVLACGGSTSTGTGSAALDAATPSFAALALDQTAADTSAPAAPALTALVVESASAQMAGPGGGCHPHLFMREREVVERVNRHVYKVLRMVEKVIATNPLTETDGSKTWTRDRDGRRLSFTIRLVGPSVYSWEFAAGTIASGPTGDHAPAPIVMTGEIDRNGYIGEHEGKGTMEVDFAGLHAAFPTERAASGTLEVRFDVSAAARKIAVRGHRRHLGPRCQPGSTAG